MLLLQYHLVDVGLRAGTVASNSILAAYKDQGLIIRNCYTILKIDYTIHTFLGIGSKKHNKDPSQAMVHWLPANIEE